MRRLAFLFLLSTPVTAAEAQTNWSIGVHTGAHLLRGVGASWSPGPSFGIHVSKSLPSGAHLRLLMRGSLLHIQNANGLWMDQTFPDIEESFDAVVFNQQMLLALRYAPLFSTPSGDFGPILDSAIGINFAKTHADLAGVEDIQRITIVEPLPTVMAAIGIQSVFPQGLSLDFSVAGQVFFSFDRGERGGGDDLRVLYGITPGLELSGHF